MREGEMRFDTLEDLAESVREEAMGDTDALVLPTEAHVREAIHVLGHVRHDELSEGQFHELVDVAIGVAADPAREY